MRALRVHEYGPIDSLTLEEVDAPEPGPGEVRIAVEAIGVNYADILMIQGRYQLRPDLPFSPGFEVAGSIDAVGAGVATVAPGTRVTANPWYGGYAEYVVLPEWAVFPLPEAIDTLTAAAATITFGTAYHALADRGALRRGETLLVTGATGGVGSAAVQIGKMLGATVIAAVGSADKSDAARELGADGVVVYGEHAAGLRSQVAEAAGGSGRLDVVLDVVGGDVFDDIVRELSPRGRLLVVGFVAGAIPRLAVNLVLLKEASVTGVFWGAFREREPEEARSQMEEIWRHIADGTVAAPRTTVLDLTAARAALADIAARRVVGKVVLRTGRVQPP